MAAEPTIRYFTMGAEPGDAWRETAVWPLPTTSPRELHLQAEGGLAEAASSPGEDPYAVDYTATSGPTSRWADCCLANALGDDHFGYDMSANDRKALTYTSDPLPDDLEVTGHPVVHLFVSSSHGDGDFFVYLKEIDADGVSRYVTEGVLRASHRALTSAPYEFMGLPYHPSSAESLLSWGDEPTELVFDLHPTSKIFAAGSRIRIAVTGSDLDNALTPHHDPAPVIRVHRGGAHPSRIVLPVVDTSDDSRS
jgi:uncharacterized protein